MDIKNIYSARKTTFYMGWTNENTEQLFGTYSADVNSIEIILYGTLSEMNASLIAILAIRGLDKFMLTRH